jgi:hypothetical protein
MRKAAKVRILEDISSSSLYINPLHALNLQIFTLELADSLICRK